ncbi:MAG TPA: LpqB family beta-propeller domain-containing protein, partial [Micromonosporaceae bacterium]
MRRRMGAAIMAGLLTLVAACGVPSEGKPIVVQRAGAPTQVKPVGKPPTPQTDFGTNETSLVSGYLASLAGQTLRPAQTAILNKFMTRPLSIPGDSTQAAQVAADFTVVRVLNSARGTSKEAGTVTVTVTVQVLGEFDPANGELTPVGPTAADRTLSFVVSTATNHYKIEKAPPGLYVSETAFSKQYRPQTIYFWDGVSTDSSPSLIPDQRYVAAWWTAPYTATIVVNWLLGDPQPPTWLGPSVIEAQGKFINGASITVVTVDSRREFVVNLKQSSMSGDQRSIFLDEIRWSLLQVPGFGATPPPVRLEVANQPVSATFNLDSNAAANRGSTGPAQPTLGQGAPPIAYAIVGGRVTPIGQANGLGGVTGFASTPSDPSRVATDAKNTDVVAAAIGDVTGDICTALVRSVSGRDELWISRVGDGVRPHYVKVFTAKSILNPQWLPNGDLAMIVDRAFRLASQDRDGNYQMQPSASIAGPGAISTFSVGPDGHRVALVSGGQIWIGTLSAGSQVQQPRQINLAPWQSKVTGLGWSTIDRLIVGGVGQGSHAGKSSVIEAYVDGIYYPLN